MRLLVLTQAVDLDDPVLGFFHSWLEEFSRRFDTIEVICLKEGRHSLPRTVTVHSLGKERGVGRLAYLLRFFALCTAFRREYDAVFVHMNEEYAILGGPLWRLWSKKIVLWRNHKMGSWRTRIACTFAHTVCYTSPEAFVTYSSKAVQMPIGIDTRHFSPPGTDPSRESMLFLGRLDKVKNPDIFVAALNRLSANGTKFHADMYGSPTYENDPYARVVRENAGALVANGAVSIHPAVMHAETSGLYGSHSIYVNLTPSGSFDKTIGEAMASGCLVVAANNAVKDVLSDLYIPTLSIDSAAEAIQRALAMGSQERSERASRGRAYIESHHSLSLLAERLLGIVTS